MWAWRGILARQAGSNSINHGGPKSTVRARVRTAISLGWHLGRVGWALRRPHLDDAGVSIHSITDGSHHALKVLVIDDQPPLRHLFAAFLELLGHEVDLAADGREGLARFDPHVHQAVLTDFLMPELTGLDVAAAIRARGCPTPIMLISGYAELDDPRRAIQAGLRFVFKPITFAQFEATMAEIVEHAAVGKAAIPCPATLRNAGGQYATSHGGNR